MRMTGWEVRACGLMFAALMVAAGCGEKDAPPADDAAPSIVRFAASPSSIEAGGASILSWETGGAERVEIVPDGGSAIDLGGAPASKGSVEVRPAATTRYVLTATGPTGKTATAPLDVQVNGAGKPTASLHAKDARIDFGQTTDLDWETTGATSVQILDGTVVLQEGDGGSGTLAVSPTTTTTYRLVASGPGGESEATARVEVAPVVVSFTSDATGPVSVGTMVTLRWQTEGAETLRVSSPDGFQYDAPAGERDSGEVSAPAGTSGAFVLTVTRADVAVTSTVELSVASGPAILEFSADPPAVTLAGTVTLTWRTTGAEFVSIESIPGGYILQQERQAEGTVEAWAWAGDTRFVLTATGAAAETVTAEIVVSSLPEPTIGTFTATPGRVGRGEEVQLAWTTTGASRVELEAGGQPVPGAFDVNGSAQVRVDADTTIVLRAFNAAGSTTERSIQVTTGAPTILSFDCAVEEARAGDALHFSWANLGGVSLEILGPDGPLLDCSTMGAADVALGACTADAPAANGDVEFTLVVMNASGEESTRTTSVWITEGAMISRFSTDRTRITEGDEIVLSWSVTPDAFGTPAILTLEDDLGVEYPLGDPPASSIVVAPAGLGVRTFTLTAHTAATDPVRATVVVEIVAMPTVSLTATPSSYDPTSGAPVALTWTSTGASSLVVHALDGLGAPVSPPVRVATPQELAAGSVDVRPTGPTSYRAVATNAAGAVATSDVLVDAPSFQILSFTATPSSIAPGEPVTLAWQTVGAVSIDLDVPQDFGVSPATDPFVDITGSATAQVVGPHTCGTQFADEGCATIAFPDSFTFPFDGVVHTQAKFFHNGFIGFDLAFSGNNYNNYAVPDSAYKYANLVAFWDDISPGTAGAIYYDTGVDARGQYMIVQWNHFTGAYQSDDMNFEIVMWDDGSFDYRYGTMTSAAGTSKALGDSATIGYQNLTGTSGHLISLNTAIPTLPNSGYSFGPPQLTPNGTVVVHPTSTRTYTLTAHGPGGAQVSETVTVFVSP